MDDRFGSQLLDMLKEIKNYCGLSEYDLSDSLYIAEMMEDIYMHDKKRREEKLGSKLSEIVDLIEEVNRDVLNNSSVYKFRLDINRREYSYYLINDLDRIVDVEIVFVENPSYTRTVSVIYDNLDRLTKDSVLEWMLSTIFKENLSC